MIVYPTRYNRDDECVEDAEFKVLGRPFATVDEGAEVKHSRGMLIAEAINAYVPGSPPKLSEISPPPSVYDLPEKVYTGLSSVQKQKLIRIERKHKKMVAKLIAKAAQAAKPE